MKMINKIGLAVGLASFAAMQARAIPTLNVLDPNNMGAAVTVVDQGPGDLNPIVGIVTAFYNAGVWTGNIETGFTMPAVGSSSQPRIDLHFSALSTGAGQLVINFAETGFSYSGTLLDQWGGTTDGEVQNLLTVNNQTVATLFANTSPFAGSTTANVVLTPADWLGLGVIVTHGDGVNITTGNKHGSPAPDGGSSLILLGSAILGLFGLARKSIR